MICFHLPAPGREVIDSAASPIPLQRIGVNLTCPDVIGMGVAVGALQGSVVWAVAARRGRNAIGLQGS